MMTINRPKKHMRAPRDMAGRMEERDLPPITDADQTAAIQREVEEVAFSRGPARRPLPQVSDPMLQWSTGLPTAERTVYSGWLSQAGRDEDFDIAMGEAGFMTQTIRHGDGRKVTHWAIETANVFVIAEGVQSMHEMKQTQERYGIAYAWRTLDDGRQQSVLRCRVFLRELLQLGYPQPLLLSVKSTLTGDMLTALTRQFDVLDALALFRQQAQKQTIALPFYACSLPLGPGQEVARGSVQTKQIVPMVAQIPEPITKEYVLTHWIKREWAKLIEARLDETIVWSMRVSQQIAAGEDAPEEWG